MIIFTALVALAGVQSTSTPDPLRNDKEMFCVGDEYTADEARQAASLVLDGSEAAVQELVRLSAPYASGCKATWKWDGVRLLTAELIAATDAALDFSEDELKTFGFSPVKLEEVYEKLTDKDKFALTLDGNERLTSAERSALEERMEAVARAAGASTDALPAMKRYFKASSRSLEADYYWTRPAKAAAK
ncbi:MAG: hypothetical protein ACJ8EY_07835 [Sphingomicrobium sp.]